LHVENYLIENIFVSFRSRNNDDNIFLKVLKISGPLENVSFRKKNLLANENGGVKLKNN